MQVQVVTPICVVCKNRGQITVESDEYQRWSVGVDAQVAFRSLDTDQRELLITGTHAHCWEKLYGSEE